MKQLLLAVSFLVLLMSSCGDTQKAKSSTEEPQTIQEQDRMYLEAYDNGQPKIKGMLKNGERDGLWIAFYENGVRWSEDNYIDGVKEGRSITFFPNGIIRYRGQYSEGEKVGLWQFYDETGKLVKEGEME